MPWTDWQFWVVTVAFLWGAWIILREIIPLLGKGDSSTCGSCATGAAACAKPPDSTSSLESDLPVIRAPR